MLSEKKIKNLKKKSTSKKVGKIFKNFLLTCVLLIFFVSVYFIAYFFSQEGWGIFSFDNIAEPVITISQEDERGDELVLVDSGLPAEVVVLPGKELPEEKDDSSSSADSDSNKNNSSSLEIVSEEVVDKKPPNIVDPSLIFGTFFDSFSSDVLINQDKTTVYYDKPAAAVFLTPDYEWRELSPADKIVAEHQDNFPAEANNFNGPYLDRRCLGADCLEQRRNDLYYNDRRLKLPAETDNYEILAVSITSLSNRWLVGFTLKDGSAYRGMAFYFDGYYFSPLITDATDIQITSSYFGLIGGGGDDNDFLLIYGGYKGIAYRIRERQAFDISRFFEVRVMRNGFKAEVVRVDRNGDVGWYVYSSTLSRPRLIKLWENGSGKIVGQAIFTHRLSGDYVIFKLLDSNEERNTLLAKSSVGGSYHWHVFDDRGFDNNRENILEFKPISRGTNISLKKIAYSKLGLDEKGLASAKFLFSANGQDWVEISAGKNIDFPVLDIKQFFLKLVFAVPDNKFHSPFLADILFDYYYQK